MSQNLAHLEGNYHKNSNLTEFSDSFYNRFYKEVNINHTLLWFSQASYMKKKILDYIGGAPNLCLRKSHRILSNLP